MVDHMKFKPVTTARLAHVFVNILAMDEDDSAEIGRHVVSMLSDALLQGLRGPRDEAPSLAVVFREVLSLSKPERAAFAERLDGALGELSEQDYFGTEGQNDPRGDRRD
jgi:hypothetical protein